MFEMITGKVGSEVNSIVSTGAASAAATATIVSGPLGTAIPVIIFAAKIGQKIVERQIMNNTNKYMNLIKTNIEIKGIPGEQLITRPWYELPHFAGYYFYLSEKFNELQNEAVRSKKTTYG